MHLVGNSAIIMLTIAAHSRCSEMYACLLLLYHSDSMFSCVCRYSGILFMIAAIILAASQHIAMIVVGRVFQGIAVSSMHMTYC